MNQYSRWQNISILLIVLLSVIYAIPNFFGEAPAVQIMSLKSGEKIDPIVISQAENILNENNISTNGTILTDGYVKFKLENNEDQLTAKGLLEEKLGPNFIIALNLLPNSPNWLEAIGGQPMYLGLDLRGGVHFLMQVDLSNIEAKESTGKINEIRSTLRENKIRYDQIDVESGSIFVQFSDEKDLKKAKALLTQTDSSFEFSKRINLGNTGNAPKIKELEKDNKFILTVVSSAANKEEMTKFAIKQNLETLNNRINELGVAEPVIQQQGDNRIVVQLPGVQDTAKAKEIIGRTALLEMRLVDDEASPSIIDEAIAGKVPLGRELYYDRNDNPLLLKKEVILTGENINNAGPGVDNQTGQSIVSLTLDGKGANVFKKVTRENIGKRIAILLIEKELTEIITAPVIKSEIGGGRVQITGMKNAQEATDVSLLLRAGSLAAPMEIIEERTVGPSMGKENIQRGIQSTLWGFIAVILLISFYYMLFGIFSSIALTINLILLIAVLSTLQATLTLPGLAAMALTVGMAIDSNVLINERIRDEIRNGNTPQASIHLGYQTAWGTILDSNITTLIAGLALFMFGTGPIKGFAVVHVLGILTSMFSAILVSRALVNLYYGAKRKINKLNIGEIYKVNN
ncbi:MAG: protein translocase subunit SecD [Methylophilaceae bacterium]